MNDSDSGVRPTPVEGFTSRLRTTIPPAVRTSLPPDASNQLIAIRLAEECKRYDELVEVTNQERRASLEAFMKVVGETRKASVPLWVRVGVIFALIFGVVGSSAAIGDLAYHFCIAHGGCR